MPVRSVTVTPQHCTRNSVTGVPSTDSALTGGPPPIRVSRSSTAPVGLASRDTVLEMLVKPTQLGHPWLNHAVDVDILARHDLLLPPLALPLKTAFELRLDADRPYG